MRTPLVAASVAAVLSFAGCSDSGSAESGGGGGSAKSTVDLLNDASDRMQDEDWAAATSLLDAVLARADATRDDKVQAWQDKVVCVAQASGEDAAKQTVAALAASGVEFAADDFAKLGVDLATADKLQSALEVIKVADDRFKDDPEVKKKLKGLGKMLAAKFAASGDSEGLDQLSALGYLSGSDDEDE